MRFFCESSHIEGGKRSKREMKNGGFGLSLRVVGTRIQRKVALKSMANHRCSHYGLLNRSNVSNSYVEVGHIFDTGFKF